MKLLKIRSGANRANLVLSRRRVWPKSLTFFWWCCLFASSRAVPSARWLVIKFPCFMKTAYKVSPCWTGLIQPWDVFFKHHAWKTLWGSAPRARWKEPPLCPKGWTSLWQRAPLGAGLMKALGINSPPLPLLPTAGNCPEGPWVDYL